MNILEIIAKKRDKKNLTKEEIDFFIKNYTNGKITDYQAAALIMAIYINGMNKEEIHDLTISMANSGEILDLSELGENIVDKHSTGGVGDKVTIVLMPIIAALGIPVAKMSGRGLGVTGGTIDKLESIPGYQTNIKIEDFKNNVKKIGISLIGQTLNLTPADKKIYALRDAISCVDCIPLIASSIMSKKIAAGANKIVIDVTCGKGAFCKNIDEAKKLATTMKEIAGLANKELVCIITKMDEPLGYAVGNSLEVIEAIEALKGNMEDDVKEVILTLGAYMIKLAKKGENIEENKNRILEVIKNGKALEKLKELVKNQGGDVSFIEDTNKFKKAKYICPIKANVSGYINEINAYEIGKLASYIGAGRVKKEDNIDETVGIILLKKVANEVKENETIAYVHANDKEKADYAVQKLQKIIKIDNKKPKELAQIIDII